MFGIPYVDFSMNFRLLFLYVLYELNVNSVIVYPSNEQYIAVTDSTAVYTIKGFACSGGGRQITRVDLSFDGGKTWEDCEREYQAPFRHGNKCWVWCHWKLETPVWKFLHTTEIAVRAVGILNKLCPHPFLLIFF